MRRKSSAAGTTIENHSQRHRHNFSLLGPEGMNNEISRAQDSIVRVTDSRPEFFRAPAGLRNPFLDPVLARLQLRLASWTRRGFDTVNGNARRRLSAFGELRCAAAISCCCMMAMRRAAGDGTPVILEVLPRLLDALALQRS